MELINFYTNHVVCTTMTQDGRKVECNGKVTRVIFFRQESTLGPFWSQYFVCDKHRNYQIPWRFSCKQDLSLDEYEVLKVMAQ